MAVRTIFDDTGRALCLGRLWPAPPPAATLRLADYLMPRALPTPPASCDYSLDAASALAQLYLNDQLGDCVVAGMAHLVGVFTGNSGEAPVILSPADIIALYGAIGGYVPGDPSTDNGCDEATALSYWQSTGAPAGANRIAGCIAVDATNAVEVRTAAWLLENLFLGIELPDQWIDPAPSASGFIWDIAGEPNPQNGHCVVGVGFDQSGIKVSTWGMTGMMTDAAVAAYASPQAGGALYAVLSPEIIARASQRAPNGLDWAQLQADFQALTPAS